MKKYFKLPLDKLGITATWEEHTKRSPKSYGQDFGWFNYQGEPVYSANDGTIMYIDKNSSCGNYIWIKHEYDNTHDAWTRYLHLKDNSIKVKVGQKVSRYQQIASMGNTGNSSGTHLHFEFWLVPKGWKFNYNDRSKYSKRSTDYAFAFEDQTIGSSANNKVITKVFGTSKQVKRDTTKNQLEIVGSLLRVRKGAGTNQTILGYIDFGIYDYTETKEANGYKWYNVGFGWVAYLKDDVKIYAKEEPEELENEINDSITEVDGLDTELEEQKQVIEQQKIEIDRLTKELDNCHNTSDFVANLKEFVANETGTYYIKLEKGEKLYKE